MFSVFSLKAPFIATKPVVDSSTVKQLVIVQILDQNGRQL